MSAYPVGRDAFFGYFWLIGDWTALALRMKAEPLKSLVNSARKLPLGAARKLRLGATLLVLTLPLSACSSMGSAWDKLFGKDEATIDQPADKLYNEGLYLLNQEKKSVAAAKRFEEVDRQHVVLDHEEPPVDRRRQQPPESQRRSVPPDPDVGLGSARERHLPFAVGTLHVRLVSRPVGRGRAADAGVHLACSPAGLGDIAHG